MTTLHFKNTFCSFAVKTFLHFAVLTFCSTLFAQGSAIPLGNDAYNIIDRLEIKTGKPYPYGTGLKPYLRGDVVRYALELDTNRLNISSRDRLDLYWLFKDNNEWLGQAEFPTTLVGSKEKVDFYTEEGKKVGSQMEASFANRRYIERMPLIKQFYKTPANFFELNQKHFHVRVNPILNFKLFKDTKDSNAQFLNQRGIEIRGGIDDRVYFYTNILETQAQFAPYINERINRDGAVPGGSLYKTYASSVLSNVNGYDYSLANGYIGFNVTKHIGLQFGHGQNVIGNGIRSMILSDFSPNYLYFKFNTRFKKFQYQNIFAQLTTATTTSGDKFAPKKYLAAHYLNYNILPNLSVGLFEAIAYGNRPNKGFDINYFNPIIFYRSVEYLGNSADNALIGAQFKWNVKKRFSLYGQLMLDEFVFGYLFPKGDTPKNWWANKYAPQIGLKYVNVAGIEHLDLQVEYNKARPYTYAHDEIFTTYTHAKQPLAHPIGANFSETIFNLRYQPIKKLTIDTRFVAVKTGDDTLGVNNKTSFGQNPLSNYSFRKGEFGHLTGQGIAANIMMLGVDVSYQFAHNMSADVHYFYRKKESADPTRSQQTNYIGAGIRVNIANRRNEF